MKLIHRDISWLSYNRRVMQEAEYSGNLPAERLKFLSIAITNLKTFIRERFFLHANSDEKFSEELRKKISKQFEKSGKIFKELKSVLEENEIHFPEISSLDEKQWKYLAEWYRLKMKPGIHPVFLNGETDPLVLENEKMYLLVQLIFHEEHGRALIEIPVYGEERFVEIPSHADEKILIAEEDVVRHFLSEIFPGHTIPESHLFEVISGREFYAQDEAKEFLKELNSTHEKAIGSFFLFEKTFPASDIKLILKKTGGSKIGSAKRNETLLLNHCSSLSSNLPDSLKKIYSSPVPHSLEKSASVLNSIKGKDELLFFPYHSFDSVIRMLNEAADSTLVRNIFMTLYRVAENSKVVEALELAVKNGKQVFVFLELKASENEEENILLAQRMERNGISVERSFPEKKVHAKVLLIEEEIDNTAKFTALLSTGNFNEKTASRYTDAAIVSADKRITSDVFSFFNSLQRKSLKEFHPKTISFSPVNYRETFSGQLKKCIEAVRQNIPSRVVLKLNNLEDEKIIHELIVAANAGVQIEIIVRSICCMKPHENIRITSIVDSLLEHARIFSFRYGENENIFITSADLMTRNLDRRIEFLLPVIDLNHQKILRDILQLEIRDNVKARLLDKKQKNKFVTVEEGEVKIQSQEMVREYLAVNA